MSVLPAKPAIREDSEGAERHSAEMKMSQALRAVSDRWASMEKNLKCEELKTRYRWARDVCRINSDRCKYGDTAVDLLFETHGIDRRLQVVYRNVGEFIEPPLVQEILQFNEQEESRYGRITWSHLVELARTSNHDIQMKMIRRCAEQRWSVDTLRCEVQVRIRSDNGLASTETRKNGAVTIAKQCKRSADSLVKAAEKLRSEDFSQGLGRIPLGERQQSKEALETVRQALMDCANLTADCMRSLDEAITRLSGERKVAGNSTTQPGGSPKRKKRVVKKKVPGRKATAASTEPGQPTRKKVKRKKPELVPA